MQNSDQLFMERALELAALGREWVSPNPMVGCVIVHEDLIIGEGFHQKYGGPHAEVNAVNAVKNKELLSESTVYVSLEPCSHFGKTPPCADLLIKHKVKKVVICNEDPFPEVAGKGIEKLKAAEIEVEIGVLKEEGEKLNKRFFKANRTRLPYIVIKWAETADRFVSNQDFSPLKISNSLANFSVHQWRSEEDAIMVGSNTIKTDNPKLNVRHWPNGKNPIRVLIDRKLSLSEQFNIFDKSQKTFIINFIKESFEENLEYLIVEESGNFLIETLKLLKIKGINSVLIEGGPTLISEFFKLGLYDEIRIIKSDIQIGSGIVAPKVPPGISLKSNFSILNNQIFIFER